MSYIDGFLLPVPKDRLDDYQALAQKASAIWREHGALEYWESVAEDLDAKDMRSFADIAGLKEGETVVFSWVKFRSREDRDRANQAIMEDPRIQALCGSENSPFDYRRMAYGGFRTLVGEGG